MMVHGKEDRRPTVSADSFADAVKEAHSKGETAKWVGEKLGMPVAGVIQRIKSWRKKGYNVPILPTGAGPRGSKDGDMLAERFGFIVDSPVDSPVDSHVDSPVDSPKTPSNEELGEIDLPSAEVVASAVDSVLEQFAGFEDDTSMEAPDDSDDSPSPKRRKKGKAA